MSTSDEEKTKTNRSGFNSNTSPAQRTSEVFECPGDGEVYSVTPIAQICLFLTQDRMIAQQTSAPAVFDLGAVVGTVMVFGTNFHSTVGFLSLTLVDLCKMIRPAGTEVTPVRHSFVALKRDP
ncbi:hypothetical protein BDR04DRAFT_1118726 [Suillus decipiens]|nr:hypothetical protein BDR04DRAFT_1118726 [Suillus decipiens]